MLQLLFAQFQTTWGEVVETLARNPGTSLEVLCESIWLLARWRSWDKELVDQIGQMAKDVFFQAHRSDGMAPLQLAAMQGDGS